MKNISVFHLKVFIFFFLVVVKFSIYLNRRVFVMYKSFSKGNICDFQ